MGSSSIGCMRYHSCTSIAPCLLQAGLAAASSLAWCFLAGLVAVPAEVLSQVPPVLLVRLLHHLNPHPTPPAAAEQANTGSLSQPIPQVTAIHSIPFKLLPLTWAAPHASSHLQARAVRGGCLLTKGMPQIRSPAVVWLPLQVHITVGVSMSGSKTGQSLGCHLGRLLLWLLKSVNFSFCFHIQVSVSIAV